MAAGLGVLVTSAYARCATAAAASLGLAGYRVGMTSELLAPVRWSRFCEKWYRIPPPGDSGLLYADRVAGIARKGSFATVIAGGDASLLAISAHRDLFPKDVVLGLPPHRVVSSCLSKANLVVRAGHAGIETPKTMVCHDAGEAQVVARDFGYPVMVKPYRAAFAVEGSFQQRSSLVARDEPDLALRLSELEFPALLQRRQPGPIISIGGVFAGDRLLATAASRYIRTWRPERGSVSFSRSVAISPRLRDQVEELVRQTGWNGVFELEMIERSPGEYAAIDFNPRMYGSMALALAAGVSLPAIWCDWLLKGKERRGVGRAGVHYRWTDADLRHLGPLLRRKDVRGIASLIRPRRGTVHPYFRSDDPLPALMRLVQMAFLALGRRLRRITPA